MISLDEINKTILELEQHDTTFATIERLAWLYTVRDHMTSTTEETLTGTIVGSEFCEACSGVPVESTIAIIAEHMELIKQLYPKEYSAIVNKISNLKV